ncbi:conserved hypothetical protein [Frankia sp. AiPs1]|uniref:hypothetical protein n=1 Tax=Frankia sp. AiPa1 TaxID=573492 RepID=UPI00202AD9B4|nr:hypothetical protein [Frankia sp. AiPa1]MCL9760814.1 hypothetical protein [Frankia sp. AiPa1]
MADLLREHRTAILLALSGLVALIVLIVCAQWFSRTRGWRRTAVHRGRQFAGGLGDLGRLAAVPYRFRRDVRAVARLLADFGLDEDTWTAFAVAVSAVSTPGPAVIPSRNDIRSDAGIPVKAAPGATAKPGGPQPVLRPFLAAVRTDSVGVSRAGQELLTSGTMLDRPCWVALARHSQPAPAPPQLPDEQQALDDPPALEHCPVAIGLIPESGGALAVLDLAALPAVCTIDGPDGPSRRLAAAIAAQLAAGLFAPTGVRLLVADTILPGFGGPTLSEALDLLDPSGRAAVPGRDASVDSASVDSASVDSASVDSASVDREAPAVRTVLVCSATRPEELARVSELAERRVDLRVVVVGRHPGSRWRLELDDLGRITAPELGLRADGAPLDRGLDRALRRRERLRRGWAPSAVEPPDSVLAADPDEPPPPGPDESDGDPGGRYDAGGWDDAGSWDDVDGGNGADGWDVEDIPDDAGRPDGHPGQLTGPVGLTDWAPTDPDELAEPEPAGDQGRQAAPARDGRSGTAAVGVGGGLGAAGASAAGSTGADE